MARSAIRSTACALGEILAAAPPAARLRAGRSSSFSGVDALALGGRLQRLEHVAVGGLDPLGLDDRGEHGLAAQRLLGVGLGLGEDLVLVAPGDLQVGLA